MSVWFVVKLVLLGAAGGAQLWKRSLLVRGLKFLVPLVGFLSFGYVVFVSYLQYRAFQSSPLSRYLLPPHHGIGYFLGYIGTRYAGAWLIAFLASVLFYAGARFLNSRSNSRFFEDEEPLLFALGAFLTGYPGFFLYVPLLLSLAVLLSVYYTLTKQGRAPLYYLWLPTAILAILLAQFVVPQSLLLQFNL